MKQIVSYGAGTNSTAMVCEMVRFEQEARELVGLMTANAVLSGAATEPTTERGASPRPPRT